MDTTEYVKTIVYNGRMINIGLDDYGQQYFLEYAGDDGQLEYYGCGSYDYDYQRHLEALFGHYTQCVSYKADSCKTIFAHGYCPSCPLFEKFIKQKRTKVI